MQTLLDVIDWANLALFVALGAACWYRWRSVRSSAAAWSAATFVLLGLTVLLGAAIPDDDGNEGAWLWLTKLDVAGLVVFPYFLYRFMRAFERPGRALDRLAALFTLGLLAWTVLLPRFPEEGEPRSAAFGAYVVAFLLHWSIFSAVVAYRLWQAGRGQPSVARRRMRLLALGAVGLIVALLLAGVGVGGDAAQLATALLGFATAALFYLGLFPPPPLRALWRRPEQERLRLAVAGLMRGDTREGIAAGLLPHVAGIVGAEATEVRTDAGVTLSAWSATGTPVAHPPDGAAPPTATIDFEGGSLLIWTGRLTPFFGREEIELLNSLGVLLALALERAETLEREREATRRLRELNELKDTFLSAVSHELRTPLTSILGFAVTLQEHGSALAPERREQLLAHLVGAAKRLEALLGDLLDLDRLSRGVLVPRLEDTDVGALVERTVESVVLDGEPPAVDTESARAAVDCAKVERIVENLLYNAYKHTPPGTRVWVTVRDTAEGVVITVADDGPGVPPEVRERIFDPFERGTARDAPGTGIGLSLVSRFAALHGGRAWVGERRGGGAAFNVLLPRQREEIAARDELVLTH